MKNLFINETFVNASENYLMGESDFYETFTSDKGELFKSLVKLYGKPQKMFTDTNEGTKQIGWIFTGAAKYEDTGNKYRREVWVEVATDYKIETKITVNHPF